MVESVREDILSYVQERVVLVEQCREHDDLLVEESVLDRLEEVLVQSRDTIADANPDPMAELDRFRDVLPLLYDSKASVLRIKNAYDRDEISLPRLNYDVGELEDAVERVADAADDGEQARLSVRENGFTTSNNHLKSSTTTSRSNPISSVSTMSSISSAVRTTTIAFFRLTMILSAVRYGMFPRTTSMMRGSISPYSMERTIPRGATSQLIR